MSEGAHAAIGATVMVGTVAYIGLHVLEPRLSLTWAYAHLNRLPGAGAAAIVAAVALPGLCLWVSGRPIAGRPVPAPSRLVAFGTIVALSLSFLGIGWFFPSKAVSLDAVRFAEEVWKGVLWTMRWYLTLVVFTLILRAVEEASPVPVPARDVVPFINALLSGLSYGLLFGCARRLGRDTFEVAILVGLAWTAFGNLQLAMYYVDIYPVVQLAFALFVWTSLRVLDREGSALWPILVGLLGPFFYVGLVLLLPALLVPVVAVARRENGVRNLVIFFAAGLLLAGAATMPAFGRPFAFGTLLAEVGNDTSHEFGLSPDSSLLPLDYMLSGAHVREYVHTFVLIDGVGLWLCLTAGLPLLVRFARGRLVDPPGLLILLIGPILVYAFVMDPLWGALADWDLFSYAAVPASLLGGYAFNVWGRRTPRLRAALFGLLLAANLIHLGARLNALHVELPRHSVESPSHVIGQDPHGRGSAEGSRPP